MNDVAVRVIACGNPDAGDDGAGLAAAAGIRRLLRDVPGAEVVEAGSPLLLLDLLQDGIPAVVVDAVRSLGRYHPGEVVRVDDLRDGVPDGLGSALSSHGLGVAETVGVASAVGRTSRVAFVGVEVRDVTAGSPMSPPVRAALPDVAAAAAGVARELAGVGRR
jgi:hydrogenase maturation protease